MSDHLFQRGKTWYGWTYDAGGKREKFSTGCTDKAAARLVLAQKEREAADPDTAAKKSATLKDAIDLLVADRRSLVAAGERSARTLDYYDAHFRPWLLFAGRKIRSVPASKLDHDLTPKERGGLVELGAKLSLADVADTRFVDAFTQHRRTNETHRHTIAHDRSVLRAALRLAKRARIWDGDVDTLFPRFDLGYKPAQHWITHENAAKLLRAVTLPHRRAYVAFILATGAELAAVERAQRIDLGPTTVRLRGSKNDYRDRHVPIVTQWQRELLALVRKHADGKGGMLFSPWGSALRSIRKACVRAKVPHVSRHGLRHTFSAWMKQEGVPNSVLYLAMGHASTAMLERIYGKPGPNELTAAMGDAIAVRRAALRVVPGGKARRGGTPVGQKF